MKRILTIFLAVIMLLSATACSRANAKPSYSPEQQAVVDVLRTADTLEISHVQVALSDTDKQQLVDLLDMDNWSKVEEPLARGFSDNFTLKKGEEKVAIFIDHAGALLPNPEGSEEYTIPTEVFEPLLNKAAEIANKSIQRGNDALEQAIYQYRDLVVGPYENWYDFSEKNLLPLTQEEVADVLQLKNWKLYMGAYEPISDNNDIPFALRKDAQEMDPGMSVLLQVRPYDEIYLAHCTFYDGPGGQAMFEIPQKVYEKLLKFKEEKLAA